MIRLELELTGVEAFVDRQRRFQRLLVNTIGNGMRRGARRAASITKTRIRTSSGLGISVFGGKGAKHANLGLNPIVSVIRPRISENGVETGLKLKGLARMIEEGGQIRRHPIPKTGTADRVMVFQSAHGTVFAKHVNHPGAPVRAHGFANAQLVSEWPGIRADVAESVNQLRIEVFGG